MKLIKFTYLNEILNLIIRRLRIVNGIKGFMRVELGLNALCRGYCRFMIKLGFMDKGLMFICR